jgi:HEAT repeat protein
MDIMDVTQIQTLLGSEDPQQRLKGITALRHHDADTAVPLLITRRDDPEFIIRSMVASGLGFKKSQQAYDVLLELLQGDRDSNVRAEAANALSKYGEQSLSHLIEAFERNNHWLVRLSIFPSVAEMDCPEELHQICRNALETDSDLTVKGSALDYLSLLANTDQQENALSQLLNFAASEDWFLRRQVALSLRAFEDDRARDALKTLRQDDDHRVVAATLEGLLKQ